MPAPYTHIRFGEDVKRRLPSDLQSLLSAEEELFRIGLFGPDIFFYYHFSFLNPVSKSGFAMHKQNAASFFERGVNLKKSRPAHAYVLGFLCHFVIDANCHSFIKEHKKDGRLSHFDMEAELDRMFLVTDFINPVRNRKTKMVVPSSRNAAVIQKLFPELNKRVIRDSLRDMILFQSLLAFPFFYPFSFRKRPERNSVQCFLDLVKVYRRSVEEAVSMILEFEQKTKEKGFSKRFQRGFDGTFFSD